MVFRRDVQRDRGDTLVEVLLAMSVIGLVLGASYAIANRSLATGRNAQEQTEAVKLAESQLEFLRANIADSDFVFPSELTDGFRTTTQRYCVVESAIVVATSADPDIDQCSRNNNGTGLFDVILAYSPQTGSTPNIVPEHFQSIVRWQRLNSVEEGEVRLLYRP